MFTTAQELKFKEILYYCLEEVRATKAAVYLVDPTGQFRLITSYGFSRKDVLPERLARGDSLVDWIVRNRRPHYLNHANEGSPELVNALAAANTSKLFTAPFYYGDRLVGFLDCRDKAGRQNYMAEDVSQIQNVVDRFLALIEAEGIFPKPERSSQEMTLPAPTWSSTEPRIAPRDGERTIELSTPPVGVPIPPPLSSKPSRAAQELIKLQQEVYDLMLARRGQAPLEQRTVGAVTPREVAQHRVLAESYLMIPEITAVVFSLWTRESCQLHVGTRRPFSGDVDSGLFENLRRFLDRAYPGFVQQVDTRRSHALLEPTSAEEVAKNEIHGIQTSALFGNAEEGEVMLFSLLLSGELAPERRDTLKSLHLLARNTLVETRDVIRYRDAFRGAISKLIEPGLEKFSALKVHSFSVGRVARRFAQVLGWTDREVERVTVAAILHDMGMRELEYDRLYHKSELTDDEKKLLREHPSLSALLVEEIPFPYPVAPLIRHHHERWDGHGYPDGLTGDQIPPGARLIAIIEAYDAMTSRSSYRAPIAVKDALDEIVRNGGTQFDPDMAPRFREFMSRPADAPPGADLSGTWTLGARGTLGAE